MTNENYTQMTNQQIIDCVREIGKQYRFPGKVIQNNHKELFTEIVNRTKFLDEYYESLNETVPFNARIYCIEHNLKSQPICKRDECNNVVRWQNGTNRFRFHCSLGCVNKDRKTIIKREQTSMKLHGTKHPMQCQEVKDKQRQKMMENHGVDHPSKIPGFGAKVKQTKFERHGDENYNNREKSWKTTQEHYNVDNPFQSEEIKSIIKAKMILNHGVDNPMKSPLIRQRAIETNLSIRGVEHALQSKECLEKAHQTMLDRHGVEYALQSETFKQKSKETCKSNCGYEYYTQSPEYHKTKRHKYTSSKYPGITFDSKWEIRVYDFLTTNGIKFEYQPNIVFMYEFNNRTWTYHPDFRVGNNVYEIKGDHFFRINESGHEVMINPYRGKGWSDQKYKQSCDKAECKHQCMLRNNVQILRGWEINNLTVDMFR